MTTIPFKNIRPVPGHLSKRHFAIFVLLSLAACSSLRAQTEVSLTGPSNVRLGGDAQYSAMAGGSPASVVWSVNGFAGGDNATGAITAAGLYSPAATIYAGHTVKVSVKTESTPVSSASLTVKVLNPLPIFSYGYITQTVAGSSFLLDVHGSGFVSGSQLLAAGADVATVFVSSTELQSTISLAAGTISVKVGILNPNAAQTTPVSRTLLVKAAAAPTLSAFSCSSASITGSGSDVCSVTLSAVASNGAISVNLGSSNAAVTVPATVTIPANAAGVAFTASASSVTTAQAVTLTASAGGVSLGFALQLNAAVPTLTVSPASIAFGNVTVNTPATQPVTLTSTGTAPVAVNSGTVTGTGFSMTGATFPVTLNPGLAVTLEVQFDPTVAGSATGQVAIQSNSSSNGTALTSLTGTGENHAVTLSWQAPASSPVPVAGYHSYRATAGSSVYQLLNASVNTATTYVDSTVVSGVTYEYYVTSVGSSGVESVASNQVAATIP